VERDAADAAVDELLGDERAEVLAAAGDDGDLVLECACGHGDSWLKDG